MYVQENSRGKTPSPRYSTLDSNLLPLPALMGSPKHCPGQSGGPAFFSGLTLSPQ
ncbi:hypothetical protein [Lysobacter gummosus]|uniref:hypothetical protein n=1 Tax=Lysobacter gummosus TaxID=262324 RepID=UPI00363C6758